MAKRVLAIVAGVSLVLAIVLSVGATWLVHRLENHMRPPANPPGQPSIALGVDRTPFQHSNNLQFGTSEVLWTWQQISTLPSPSRPWTRWWWPGGDVELPVLRAQLDELAAAGFGGVEIQPFISGMINVAENETLMQRVYSFDTPAYHKTLNDLIAHAADIGMHVDLTNFSGWPPGGPQINLEDSPTIMAYAEETVRGGGTVAVELPRPRPGPAEYMFAIMEFAGVDFMNFPREHARLASVLAARVTGGERSRNPFNMVDTLELDPASVIVLTDRVTDGVLHWDAPEGEWHIVSSYLLPSGEVPMGAAQQPQGFVVDHLREEQVLGQYAHAFGEATGLPRQYGAGLRGIFNDSLEFRLRRMSAEDILEEFKRRRGYDLEPWLPALYIEGVDNMYFRELLGVYADPEFRLTDMDERIRHDYQQTLSDLVIERFIETSAHWAESRGLTSRGQSYGMDMDIIRGLGANTIPETEQLWAGGANAGLKFASSAAALYGRPLASAESFVWINRDYMPTARRVKAAADKLFLAGINHIVYHGTPYTWHGAKDGAFGEEGWQPFSGPQNPAHFSGNFSAANTAVWPDLPQLNAYIARSQALLRRGAPDVDVLVYYPFLGFHGFSGADAGGEALVNGSLPDADPPRVLAESGALAAGKRQMEKMLATSEHVDPRVDWINAIQPLLHELDRRGVTWAWVNDHALQGGKASAGHLVASGGSYRALLLPDIEALDPATLPALQAHVDAGVPVVFAGELPTRQRSFHNAATGDARVRDGVTELLGAGAQHLPLSAGDLRERLAAVSSQNLRQRDGGTIHRQRRVLANGGEILFFANQSPDAATLALYGIGQAPLWWFDALSGSAWPATADDGALHLSVAGFESRFLVSGVEMPETIAVGVPPGAMKAAGGKGESLADWQVVYDGADVHMAGLTDWRELDALRYVHGPVTYRHNIVVDTPDVGSRYVLDLGLVQGSASVAVNGQDVGRASLPPFVLDVGAALRPGTNTIEVEVRAPLRNLFLGRATAGDPLYANMLEFEGQTVAAGLFGPVTLYRYGEPR